MRVALFDYGAGNLHSLDKALAGAGADVHITADWDEALDRDALVLPGVGAFGPAVTSLSGRAGRVRDALANGLPCLGICLGMQLLFPESEEAAGEGIGWIPGRVQKLGATVVPQMGWNDVTDSDDTLFADVNGLIAYYANSFVCRATEDADVIAWSEYEGDRFAAAVRRGNTWGVQFHPEKSTTLGLRLIENFLAEVSRTGGNS